MTDREAYVFLGQIRGYDNKIKRLERTIESLRYNLMPGAIRYDKDRVQTSPQDSMSELFSRIDEYERELGEEYNKRAQAVIEIDEALNRMDKTKERTVLKEYYIGQSSIRDIADGLGFTIRHCLRLKKNGVSMFAEVMSHGDR